MKSGKRQELFLVDSSEVIALAEAQGFISGNQNCAFVCALAINKWKLKCVIAN